MKQFSALLLLLLIAIGLSAQDFQTNIIKYASTGLDSDSGADFIDFDGDGKLDVWAGFESRYEFMVYKNLETTFHIETITDTCFGYFYMDRVDFNQDGFDDMLVSCYPPWGDQGIYAYINDGSYNYIPHFIFYADYDAVEMIEVADMDNDGDLDLIIDMFEYANFFWYVKNEGNQTYSSSYVNFIGQPAELYGVADLNGDSLPDVLGAYFNFNVNEYIIVAAENDTTQSGGFIVHEIDTVGGTWEGVVADFVGDSLPDLIVSPIVYSSNDANVWRNNGNFNFSLETVATVQNYCRLYMPDDYDGDGDMDALSFGIDGIEMLKNLGNSTFLSVALTDEYAQRPVAWEDVNGDGLKDILTNAGSRNQIYLQKPGGSYELFWTNSNGGSDRLLVFDADGNGTNDILMTEGSYIRKINQTFDEKRLPVEESTPVGIVPNWDEWEDALYYDFDDDGDLDILMGHEQGLYILYNYFGEFSSYLVGTYNSTPRHFRRGDIDQDGDPDFIILTNNYIRLEWDGTSFTQTMITGNSHVYDIMDVDGDGDEDIIRVKWNLSLQKYELEYLQNNNNSYTNIVLADMSGIVSNYATNNDAQLRVYDIDQDGDKDIFLSNYNEDEVIWLRNDSLIFTPFTLSDSIDSPKYVMVEDMDQDGDNDVIFCSVPWGEIYLFSNDGSENFTGSIICETAAWPENLVLVDYDKDGDTDLFTNSQKDYKTVWVENLLIDCPRTYASLAESICEGDSMLYAGEYISAEGLYYDTLQNSAGCDSVLQLTLSFIPPIITNLSETICPEDSAWFAGIYLSIPGTYTDTLVSTLGCDSIVKFHLYNHLVPTVNLTQNVNVVSAPSGYTAYAWYRNDTLITGENQNEVDASLYGEGTYQVSVITGDGCLVFSNVLIVSLVHTDLLNLASQIKVFPNPVDREVQARIESKLQLSLLKLLSVEGRVLNDISIEEITSDHHVKVDMSMFANGIYLLQFTFNEGVVMKRIIKE